MKAALRLEISKRDELDLMDKVDELLEDYVVDPESDRTESIASSKQEIIEYYRSQLREAFKLGRTYNPNLEETS